MDESQPILPVFIVKEPIDAETEIRYQFFVMATNITATAPDDYMAPQQAFYFIEPGRQQLTYVVIINEDAIKEGIETFQLELFVAEQPHFLLGSITRATVTITEDSSCEDKEGREGRGWEGREGKWREYDMENKYAEMEKPQDRVSRKNGGQGTDIHVCKKCVIICH